MWLRGHDSPAEDQLDVYRHRNADAATGLSARGGFHEGESPDEDIRRSRSGGDRNRARVANLGKHARLREERGETSRRGRPRWTRNERYPYAGWIVFYVPSRQPVHR